MENGQRVNFISYTNQGEVRSKEDVKACRRVNILQSRSIAR